MLVANLPRSRSYAALRECPLAPYPALREAGPAGAPRPRLLDRVREALRTQRYSRRTEKTYVAWMVGAIDSRPALRLIREWATLHRGELEENWRLAKICQPLRQIAPLE